MKGLQMKFKLKKLNELGFDHVAILVVFVVGFALVGAYFLFTSLAATTYVQLHVGSYGSSLCVDSGSLGSCSASNKDENWQTLSGSNFQIKNDAGQCIDDWNAGIQKYPQSDTSEPDHTRVPVHATTCYSKDANQEWNWSDSRLVNEASKGCLNALGGNSAGATLGVYSCNSGSNELYFEKAVSVSSGSGGGSTTSDEGAAFIVRARKWQGLGYANSGGYGGDGGLVHADGYATFVKDCEGVSDGGTPHIVAATKDNDYATDTECATDCSGFVSMVVDDVLHTNYVWIAGDQVLTGTGASNWKAISASDAEPGDIAVSDDHTEFVDAGTGSGLTSFGEHESGTTVSTAHMPTPFTVYRWE